MGGRGASSNGSRIFEHFADANTAFGVGQEHGMYPDWERSVSQDEREASVYYTTDAYREINKYLRGKNLNEAPDKIKNTVRDIDTAMKKFNLTENITVFRGGSNKLVGGASTLEEIKALAGTIVRDNGIMSTAVTQGAAWSVEQYRRQYRV